MLVALASLALALGPAAVAGQEPRAGEPARELRLEEALELASAFSPVYRSAANDAGAARWQERAAWGGLLPQLSTSLGMQYLASGTPRFGLFTSEDVGVGATPDYYFSDYTLGLTYELSADRLFGVGQARANRRAVEARVDAAGFDLVSTVTRQYVAGLRARDALRLAEQDRARADENWRLAQARVQVGAASPLDSLQAAVERGRAEVAVLDAATTLEEEKLRLMERIGRELPRDVALTSELEVFDPPWTLETLLADATTANPTLRADRAAASAAQASVRAEWGSYMPTLRLTAGWSGFTREASDPGFVLANAEQQAAGLIENCQLLNTISAGLSSPLPGRPGDCSEFVLTDAQRRRLVDQNAAFPFAFERQPLQVELRVSLPLFQGFSRQRDLEEAQVAAEDARETARATELRLRTEVAAALERLEARHVAVGIEERNRALADAQFELAQERYRLGAAPYLELRQAETEVARAHQAHLESVYGFHETLADLEALVGRSLREAN